MAFPGLSTKTHSLPRLRGPALSWPCQSLAVPPEHALARACIALNLPSPPRLLTFVLTVPHHLCLAEGILLLDHLRSGRLVTLT